MTSYPSDARLWALVVDELQRVSAASIEEDHRTARRIVAVVRRERGRDGASTWAPGDEIPLGVTEVYDLDGDVWVRQSADPESMLRDTWKMRGFDPNEHEGAAGGAYVTPALLDTYGPVTAVVKHRRGTVGT